MKIGSLVEMPGVMPGKWHKGEVVWLDTASVGGKRRTLLEVKIKTASGESTRLAYADKCKPLSNARTAAER